MAGFTNSLETSFGRWVIGYTIYPSKICEKLCTPNNKWKLIEKKKKIKLLNLCRATLILSNTHYQQIRFKVRWVEVQLPPRGPASHRAHGGRRLIFLHCFNNGDVFLG